MFVCGNRYDIGKILVAGGGKDQDGGDAELQAYVYDINGLSVSLEQVDSMHMRRIFGNAVVLPTGEVVVAGGQTKARKFSDRGGVLQAEIWNPTSKQFKVLAAMKNVRAYHSTCLLTKDARVACMGGGL
jgi:galactose oxidase